MPAGTSCQVAICLPEVGRCGLQPVNDGTACEDGDLCTQGETCLSGACTQGEPLVCDDANPCTVDACDAQVGCVHVDASGPCEDGNSCTDQDTCEDGVCRPGPNECPCTELSDCAAFEDGDACNGTLACVATSGPNAFGEIDAASVVTCDVAADPPCQQSRCDPLSGACALLPIENGNACADNNACVADGRCMNGECEPGPVGLCEDNNPCTQGECHANFGCVYTDNGSCSDCQGLSCLPCAQPGANQCALEGPFIEDTCCAVGDSLLYMASGTGAEVVDIEVDDRFAWLCGGFGVRVNEISDPAGPVYLGQAEGRCQHIAVGGRDAQGKRVFYLAHHGDSWVPMPFMSTWTVDDLGNLALVAREEDGSVLFEGLAYANQHLYVASHQGGLRVYSVGTSGAPTLLHVVSGFDNAVKVAVAGDTAYVADGQGGLKVVDISEPAHAAIVQSVPTAGLAKDVDVSGGRVFVARGSDGIDVFDAFLPQILQLEGHIEVAGSTQGVAADGRLLAAANWTHLAVYDTTTLQLVGTEDLRTFPRFDQVFGVALRGDLVFAGEWEGLHIVQHRPGYVGPDLWIENELLSFEGNEIDAQVLVVRNRGQLDLDITQIQAEDPDLFTVEPTYMLIPPGGADVMEVLYTPPAEPLASVQSRLIFHTNDPDSNQNPFEMFLITGDSTRLNVGDVLTPPFGFLDEGGGDVNALGGNVIVLAYFALF
jgi:hypothetical protein